MIYFCPTPIGNLKDITLRTIETLKKVDIIYCEDTRVSLKLLNNLEIKKTLKSYHKFNEREKVSEIIELSKENEIAIISDAGLPAISDPGEILVKELIKENIDFEVLPGPSASLTALVLSGLSSQHFFFYGFLENKSSARKRELEDLKKIKSTLIFYESPNRIYKTLNDMLEVLGDRNISISREITKLYERTYRGKISQLLEEDITLKGEFVIVVEGNNKKEEVNIRELLEEKLKEGIKKSKAVKEISNEYDLPKNEVYKISLELSEDYE